MRLDENANYIVSGLERSGTSLLMQILDAGGIPTAFDMSSRPADENNPKGYYELAGGKVISRLVDGSFPLARYRGKFIKITAFGLRFLPEGKYKIIYSQRNIEEILDSMEKMAKIKDENRDETREAFVKLDTLVAEKMKTSSDVDILFVSYNDIISNPKIMIENICSFLGVQDLDQERMAGAVDKALYRNRRS